MLTIIYNICIFIYRMNKENEMKEKIMIGKKTITVCNGYHEVRKIKACLFVDPTKINNDGCLDVFVIVDGKQFKICEYGTDFAIEILGMTREDWIKFNWKDLVK